MFESSKSVRTPLSLIYGKEDGILVEYMDYLYIKKRVAESTAYNYYMTLRHLAKFLTGKRLNMICDPEEVELSSVSALDMASISETEFNEYIHYCSNVKSEKANTLSVRLIVIRGLYRWLYVVYHFPTPEFIYTYPINGFRKKPFIYIDNYTEKALYDALDGSKYPSRNKCIISLILNCGLSVSDVVRLNLDNINVSSIVLVSDTGERIIRLDEKTKKFIDEYLNDRIQPLHTTSNVPFFVSEKKGRLDRLSVEKMIRICMKRVFPFTDDRCSARDLHQTYISNVTTRDGITIAYSCTNITTSRYFRATYGKKKIG